MPNRPRPRDEQGRFFCQKCKNWLLKEAFDASKRTHYGIQPWCRECIKQKRYEWHGTLRAHLFSLMNKAKKRGREFTLDEYWALQQWEKQDGLCYYTGTKMTHSHGNGRSWTNVSIDRIDSNQGYTPNNCVLCCTGFNLMKTNLPLDALLTLSRAFLDKMGS